MSNLFIIFLTLLSGIFLLVLISRRFDFKIFYLFTQYIKLIKSLYINYKNLGEEELISSFNKISLIGLKIIFVLFILSIPYLFIYFILNFSLQSIFLKLTLPLLPYIYFLKLKRK